MITAPTNCPCCNSILEWSKDQLYCRNPECSSSLQKKIEHFAKTLKIKGLGPATINKLGITKIVDIYDLSEEEISKRLGSERLAVKLWSEIEKSKTKTLNDILPAFGISLIGKSATEKLSKVCNSIYDINIESCKQAGLGEKSTNNLLEWLETAEFMVYPFDFFFLKSTDTVKKRGVICISGKLNSFSTKQSAREILEKLGFDVKDNLTKEVTILVNESGKETSKTKKARETGIQIVNNLSEFIGEIE